MIPNQSCYNTNMGGLKVKAFDGHKQVGIGLQYQYGRIKRAMCMRLTRIAIYVTIPIWAD